MEVRVVRAPEVVVVGETEVGEVVTVLTGMGLGAATVVVEGTTVEVVADVAEVVAVGTTLSVPLLVVDEVLLNRLSN